MMKQLFFIILVLISSGVKANNDALLNNNSIRALFDEDFFWMTQKGADKYVADAKRAGFNVLIPCVWHGNGATWKSKIAPYGKKWSKKFIYDSDPLKYLIDRAHKEGLQVHPWFTVMLRTDQIFDKKYDTSMPKMFNIHDRNFGSYISNIINELVINYNIDGVNLDYIRSKEVCDSLYCIRNYKLITGHNLSNDLLILKISSSANNRVINWQVNAVTSIVRKISNAVKLSKPSVIVSVDTLVNDEKWTGLGANSSAWLNEGIIDYIFHMDYQNKLFIDHINRAKKTLKNPEKMLVLVANYDFDKNKIPSIRPTNNVKAVMKSAIENWPESEGIGLYEYRFINEEQINMIKQDVFIK